MGDNIALAVKLIPVFEGDGEDVIQWLDNVKLVCDLQNIKDIAKVLPLRLKGGAAAAYAAMSDDKKKKFEEIKEVLMQAFAMHPLEAWEKFEARKMLRGETPDRFLNALHGLATRFGGVADKVMLCKFVTGLPHHAQQALRTHDHVLTMTLEKALKRARVCVVPSDTVATVYAGEDGQELKEGENDVCAAGAVGGGRGRGVGPRGSECYACGGPNHLARHCTVRARDERRCFKCDKPGHIAAYCPEGERQGRRQPQAGQQPQAGNDQ